jgi:hypothetical protein
MKPISVELNSSILDLEIPIKLTEQLYEKYCDEIELRKKYGEDVTSIRDITPNGNFVYRQNVLRIEVDNRYITNKRAVQLVMLILKNISK